MRMVKSNEDDELIIGPTDLFDALQQGSFSDQNEGFVNDEARQRYDEKCSTSRILPVSDCLKMN